MSKAYKSIKYDRKKETKFETVFSGSVQICWDHCVSFISFDYYVFYLLLWTLFEFPLSLWFRNAISVFAFFCCEKSEANGSVKQTRQNMRANAHKEKKEKKRTGYLDSEEPPQWLKNKT